MHKLAEYGDTVLYENYGGMSFHYTIWKRRGLPDAICLQLYRDGDDSADQFERCAKAAARAIATSEENAP